MKCSKWFTLVFGALAVVQGHIHCNIYGVFNNTKGIVKVAVKYDHDCWNIVPFDFDPNGGVKASSEDSGAIDLNPRSGIFFELWCRGGSCERPKVQVSAVDSALQLGGNEGNFNSELTLDLALKDSLQSNQVISCTQECTDQIAMSRQVNHGSMRDARNIYSYAMRCLNLIVINSAKEDHKDLE